MDIEKAGCYKLYRCRSLLACDSGGTVYDTSQRLEDSDGESFYKNADESQSESGQSENIIYIIDNDNRVKTSNSPTSQQSLTDPNTQLDDDEFNNYEPYSYASNDSQCDIVQYVKEEGAIQNDNCKYYIVQCDDIDSTQNSATETVDSDSFDRENFEYYCDSLNLSSSVEDASLNSNKNDAVSGNTFFVNQAEAELLNLSNFSQETARSIDPQDVTDSENYSSFKPEVDSTTKHSRKRKQTYKVKNDSFTELVEEDESSDASTASDISKKRRPAYRRDNQKRKLQFENVDPFENLKMSSILKKDHSSEDQFQSKDRWRESLASSNDDNSEPSTPSSNDEEVFNCSERSGPSRYSSCASSGYFFKNLDAYSIKLNSDLTNADYLEYVQPREKIVESNMDKLLSPTIEVEISTIMNHCKIEQHIQAQMDCNGNEVKLKDNSNEKITASEVVEKQLVSKAAYARKLGFSNYFNTSNECVVDEILFDRLCAYKEIKLEIDWTSIRNNFQPKAPLVLLENTDQHLTQHQQSNGPFKSLSCSLKDTLNDFDRFGEFSVDNSKQEEQGSQTKEIINMVQKIEDTKASATSEAVQKLDVCKKFEIHSIFKPSSGANSVISDVNANYDSSKHVSSSSTCEKLSIAPLKMRIKRVSDDNQYVIDDSSILNYQVNDIKSSRFQKNPDSKYECSCCSATFRTKKLLKSHISENHNGPYDSECEICFMKSKKSSAHKKHYQWCERSTVVKCEVCAKVYCCAGEAYVQGSQTLEGGQELQQSSIKAATFNFRFYDEESFDYLGDFMMHT